MREGGGDGEYLGERGRRDSGSGMKSAEGVRGVGREGMEGDE